MCKDEAYPNADNGLKEFAKVLFSYDGTSTQQRTEVFIRLCRGLQRAAYAAGVDYERLRQDRWDDTQWGA